MLKVIEYSVLLFIVLFLFLETYLRIFGNYCEPWFDEKMKIVKRQKNTEGIYQTTYTKNGYFKINNEGWNSHRDYFERLGELKDKDKNGINLNSEKKIRIAIVGHSNIEGLRVSVYKTLSKVFEESLNKNGVKTEVYTFGFGGMHMAQALNVSRYVVDKFQPDILIVGTYLTDFLIENTSKYNFLSLAVNIGDKIVELPPNKYMYEENSFFSFLYYSKAIRYADKKTKLGEMINCLLYEKNKIDKTIKKNLISTGYCKKTLLGIDYILNQFEEISGYPSGSEVPIFFINFPIVIPSCNYNFQKIHFPEKSIMNTQTSEKVRKHHFKVINLEQTFIDEYNTNNQKYDFANDYHYNEHAHEIIGMQLSKHIRLYLQNKLEYASN